MTVWEDIQTSLNDFWNWLTGVGGGLTDSLGELGSWLYGGIKWLADQLYNAWTYFSNWLYSGLQYLSDRFKEGYEAIAQWIRGGLQWIGSGLSWIGQQLYSFGQWVWNGIVNTAVTVANTIEGFINWIWESIVNIYNDIVNYLASWVQGINDFLNDWIKSLRSKFKDLVLVNTTLPAIFKSFDMLTEGKLKEGILGMLISPFAGAIAGELVDVIVPRPSSERIMFFPEFLFPTLTYTPITIKKPTTPTTPIPTEIPSTPMYPPAIGYRSIVEKLNLISSRYEIYTQRAKTAQKYNSISSMYGITLQRVTEVSKVNLVSSVYRTISTAPIEVSKSSSVESQYETFQSLPIEVSKSNLVKSMINILTSYGGKVPKVNSISSVYEIISATPVKVSKCNLVRANVNVLAGYGSKTSGINKVKTEYEVHTMIPVNRVVNGGFETGDLTGWSSGGDKSTGSDYFSATVQSDLKHSGSYSCKLFARTSSTGNWVEVWIAQNVDLTGVDTLEFWYRITETSVEDDWPVTAFRVYIDSNTVFGISARNPMGSWEKVSINVSGYNGVHTIKFLAEALKMDPFATYSSRITVYIDDVKAIAWE